jgi:rod shape-determining protein MreC
MMRRNWRSNRGLYLLVCLLACIGLVFGSVTGLLKPVEDLLSTPLNAVTGFVNRAALSVNTTVTDLGEIQTLRQRNADLEEALAQFQSELVALREIASDYQRLTGLLDYTTTVRNQEVVTADVIAVEPPNTAIRTITVNRGARDGIALGMPVVTGQGLVGRVMDVSANAARILLINDQRSAVSARLQTSRVEGSVIGLPGGGLRMTFIPLDSAVQEGDLVLTSGLGGNFPSDIVIGQVTSVRDLEFELYQEAEVRSLINFDTLEFVLVITSFQPIDLSVFEAGETDATAP